MENLWNCAPTEALDRSTEVSVRFVIKASRSMVRIDTTSVHSDDLAGLSGAPHFAGEDPPKEVPEVVWESVFVVPTLGAHSVTAEPVNRETGRMHFSNQQRNFSSNGLSERGGIVAYFSMEIAGPQPT